MTFDTKFLINFANFAMKKKGMSVKVSFWAKITPRQHSFLKMKYSCIVNFFFQKTT